LLEDSLVELNYGSYAVYMGNIEVEDGLNVLMKFELDS
jgi:hypothetical protein